ncbi:hypothetical protein KGF54_002300 [Candida jiufengensis]|uniref:uncharacterized protein n=1 Tax=Candida jiufengensis TaxID=497108 RepID=UPI0022250EAF|nr:uncharacterized protein KGF54_002300 [Candida jiufengensis]KAI5954525.1 hypothetical protein KGF54_002300 [Candida jiufengensis]
MSTILLDKVKQLNYTDVVILWRLGFSLYPITYIISIPLTYFLQRYSGKISEIWSVKFLENYIVRNYIILWFTILYFGNLLNFQNSQVSISFHDPKTVKSIKIYFLNIIWLTILLEWFFGSPIFERVSIALGAYCTKSEFNKEYKCEQNGGKWINLFDSSSHYTMLISNSLLIWYLVIPYISRHMFKNIKLDLEQAGLQQEPTIEEQPEKLKTILVYLSLLFIVLWYISFCITSLFFHTITEKLVGLFCGLFVPIMIQFIN